MSNSQPEMFVTGTCPSCKEQTRFQFIGVQECLPSIAKQLGIPTKINLYRCQSCDTSVNEFALHNDSATAS